MSLPQGLLNNRAICALVSLLCLISSVRSWVSMTGRIQHRGDLFNINTLFLALPILIVVSIAYKSSFWADRVVFGALAGVGALIVVRRVSLAPPVMFAADVASALMWTIAGLVSLTVLVLGFRSSRGNHLSQGGGRTDTRN
jgi:hypothetical protein